ncbi:MAG: hypothetical protein HKO53_19645 [Gemmatimonadetes bacterium]|nr:hypothetical protein [Gemmatimonadota bacterium]
MARWTGASHAVCLPRARTGLFLALRHFIEPGQNVVLSPYTFHDVINMVLCAGGRPVFADLEPGTCNISPSEVKNLIDGDTAAVIATHLYGIPCDIEQIAEICLGRGVPLIEDAAQCLGGRVGGRRVGTIGDAGVFSFSRVKNVTALYGGMLVTNSPTVDDRVRTELRGFPLEERGRLWRQAVVCSMADVLTTPLVFQFLTAPLFRYHHRHDVRALRGFLGSRRGQGAYHDLPSIYEKRMTSLQARLVMQQLDEVDRHAAVRVEHAHAYHTGLADVAEMQLPPLKRDGSHVYLSFPVLVDDREGLVDHMIRRGRDVRGREFDNAADLPCFAEFARECPNARAAAERCLALPTYPQYSPSEVERNIRVIREYFGLERRRD